jgi:hypothetical protein
MARLTPRFDVLRALFVRSGNYCAFPGCNHLLINQKNKFVAQVCHIEAAEEGGERYNPTQTDEDRRGYNNLILLCYQHHVETDDVMEYPVSRLISMKHDHEQCYYERPFEVDPATLITIRNSFTNFYSKIERLNKYDHIAEDLKISIDFNLSFFEVADQIRTLLSSINNFHDELREHEKKNINNNWETLNLGLVNMMTEIRVKLDQLELFHLEKHLLSSGSNPEIITRLDALKESFQETAIRTGYAD